MGPYAPASVVGQSPARMSVVKIVKFGAYTIGGGVLAVALSFILGAGPCNATTLGVILMMLGLLAIPVGFITLIVGVIATDKKPA